MSNRHPGIGSAGFRRRASAFAGACRAGGRRGGPRSVRAGVRATVARDGEQHDGGRVSAGGSAM